MKKLKDMSGTLVFVSLGVLIIAVMWWAKVEGEKGSNYVEYTPSAMNSYYYVDRYGVIHTDLKCHVLSPYGEDVKGDVPYYAVRFIIKEMLTQDLFRDYCSHCVSEVEYEAMKRIIDRANEIDW